MSRQKQPVTTELILNGAALPPQLTSTTTETGGSPAVTQGNGSVALTLDATSEPQAAVLYQGDKLAFDIDDLQSVEIVAELDAEPGAEVSVGLGVCSAQNDTLDSIAEGAFFRLDAGSLAVKIETDDGTTDKDDVETGVTLTAATPTKFRINFRDGIQHRVGANSLGGKAAVQFALDNAQGNLRPVNLNGTIMDMSAYSGRLQLFAQIAKASGTAAGTLTIHSIKVEHLAY